MAIVLLFGPLSKKIINEVLSHPLLTKEFLYSWFDGFKNVDVNKLENRKMLMIHLLIPLCFMMTE